jgi:hypothetical protein
MRVTATMAFIAVGGSLLWAQAQPARVGELTAGTPHTVRAIDSGAVSGIPTRLAWSLDGAYLYVRLSTFDRWSNEAIRHILIEVATARPQAATEEPAWLARCWNTKAALTSPAVPAWRIVVESRHDYVRATNVPRGGDIAQFTSDPSASVGQLAGGAVLSQQKVLFEEYRLNGHVIAASINEPIAAGRTYGWAPAPWPFLAFVTSKGRLAIMDATGAILELRNTQDARLPAWREDGRAIAYVQQMGRNSFSLRVVDIG